MKWFKPFTPKFFKKEGRCCYRYSKMKRLAEINELSVDLKEKYGRMDATMYWWDEHHLVTETMEDYEALSEESCMYCNKHCKQYWTHEDSWLIHLCLPCLIGDKVTILLERIITRWRKERREGCMRYLIYICIVEVILFCGWIYYEIYFLTVS